ncbi:MAG: tetratricopeptide repeat protein, partial [Methanosarcinaceae archaeon]|nr:tetratricopeptide repeat protein [Methanosarcinaceae archaeon]
MIEEIPEGDKNTFELLKRAKETSDYDEKIKLYDEVLELDRNFTEAWYQKGFALDRKGKSDEALTCYNEALKIDPGNPGVWCLKGFVLNNMQK